MGIGQGAGGDEEEKVEEEEKGDSAPVSICPLYEIAYKWWRVHVIKDVHEVELKVDYLFLRMTSLEWRAYLVDLI